MASDVPTESHVKVTEYRDYVDDYNGCKSEMDAGEATKRRRITHDYRKLSKLGYDPSVSTTMIQTSPSDSKGKKRKRSEDSPKELCLWTESSKPAKISKIWPVFDSGGYGDTAVLTLHVMKKCPPTKNPLIFNTTCSDFDLDDINQTPLKSDWSGGLYTSWKQTQMSKSMPNDVVTRRIFSSVFRQLRIINTHFQHTMFRYKYPRVTRTNVLLENTMRRPASHLSLTLKAIIFQPTPQRYSSRLREKID